MLVIELSCQNAYSSIVVPPVMTTSLRVDGTSLTEPVLLNKYTKVFLPLIVGPAKGILILVSELQSSKTPEPILVTSSGIVILVSELQPEKTLYSILVTLSGIIILFSELQPEKVLSSMLVTPFGIVMLVSEMQSENAPLPNPVRTPYQIAA